ncbi:MAG: glutamate--tRNA ligase [Elusimicrobiota bacterium]|jgi:glutamyl-tRNA synthetase|nr:glutamate--tRNA ligase [Elusimicrobiota bacterium]
MAIRVRFAPSPTGFLHIGGARTALYNYLFARHNNGKFILRIEDTDEVRSTEESVLAILQGMKWLGLDWDEGPVLNKDGRIDLIGDYGPYLQSKRIGMYQKYIDKLVTEGKAYKCFCTTDELVKKRELANKEKRPPKYDNTCRNLTEEQIKNFEKQGKKSVIRFKNSGEGQTVFDDVIKGRIVFENNLLDDFVIVKSSGVPIYNFAVVLDDYLMKISHVIRGDDHISNTPRQIMLYKALGFELPQFAHIPMILGSDGARLSKRHGATSVLAYKDMGYLPEALVNYLALLGWATSDSQQLFKFDELIKKFDLKDCNSSAAIFDDKKLIWMNGEYIREKSLDEFTKIALPILQNANLVKNDINKEELENLKKILILEQEKVKLLTDLPELFGFILKDKIEYNEIDIEKFFKKDPEKTKNILENIKVEMAKLNDFTTENLESLFREYAEKNNLKTGQVFHPVRLATSGKMKGPSLFHYLEILGRKKAIERIDYSLTNFFK